MKNRKTLRIIRGLPGSGKTTVANMFRIKDEVFYMFEADQFFYDQKGNYNFDASKLSEAHKQCFDNTESALVHNFSVNVSNTFTTEKEIKPYKELAEKYNANFVSIIVENRHGNKSVHNVPDEAIERMKNRFTIKL